MKRITYFLIALVLALCLTAPAQAEFKDFWADVYSWDGQMSVDGKPVLSHETADITFKVLQRNSDTAETLYEYADGTMTSLTNPVTAANFASATVCNDKVAFKVDPTEATDTYVDLIVVDTTGGYTYFFEDFTVNDHTIVIDERPGVVHQGMIWFTLPSTTETSTGVTFAADTLVQAVQVEVVTVDTTGTGTMDVGTDSSSGGTADGFLNDVATSSTGYIQESISTSGSFMDSTDFYMSGYSIDGTDEGVMTYRATTGTGAAGDAEGYIHYRFVRTR